MEHLDTVTKIVEDKLKELNAFLVDLSLDGRELSVKMDTIKGVNIDACRKVNRAIDEYLIENEVDWSVEVGSPGLSDPFTVKAQYDKNVGREVELKTVEGKKYKGVLKAVTMNGVLLEWTEKVKIEGKKKKIKETLNKSFSFEQDEELEQIKETKVVISFK